jgi:hypothetical protein
MFPSWQFEVVTPDAPHALFIAPQHSQDRRAAGAGPEANGKAKRFSVLEWQRIGRECAAAAGVALDRITDRVWDAGQAGSAPPR